MLSDSQGAMQGRRVRIDPPQGLQLAMVLEEEPCALLCPTHTLTPPYLDVDSWHSVCVGGAF